MKLLLLVLVAVGCAAAAELFRGRPDRDSKWQEFKNKHGKKYKHAEDEAFRRKRWEETQDTIEKHNEEADAGKHTYRMADNHLSDWTDEEFESLQTAQVPDFWWSLDKHRDDPNRQTTPDSLDLRSSSCMPAVKNQGQCGSCWAFAANTPYEYRLCQKTGALKLLSEQQLVDCSRAWGNYGCNGGWYWNAWSYVKNVSGEATSAAYPYTATNGTCTYTASLATSTLLPTSVRLANSEATIRSVVASTGPVAVAIKVLSTWRSYSSGVYDDPACPTDSWTISHAVVIVGYGSLNGINHWIVRNSWGPYWGSSGYVLMKRGTNACNIEAFAAYPIV